MKSTVIPYVKQTLFYPTVDPGNGVLNDEVALHLNNDKEGWEKKARDMTKTYATED